MKSRFAHAIGRIARLPVGWRLQAGFGVVTLLMLALGGMAVSSLSQVNERARELDAKWMQGVGYLDAMRVSMADAREAEVKHSHTDDKSYQTEYEQKMGDAEKAVAGALGSYQHMVGDVAERELFSKLDKNWAEYLKSQRRVVTLGREKKQADAAAISDGLSATAYEDASSPINALNQLNFKGGKEAAAHAAAVYESSRRWVLGLLALGVTAGVMLAFGITRQLLRQLGGEPSSAAEVARAVAEGDLTTVIALRPSDRASVMAQLADMQQSLSKVVANVRQNSEAVATASAEIAQGNNDLSSRTEQQASALEETAASMEELSSTVKQNADNAREANQLALSASTVAVKGGEVVSQVVDTMRGINDSSKKIADIISVIDGIAFQTNILALNAAVEAARAGEQGRGFAVVASEVRSLAGRSANAAKEIKILITASVERVAHGTTLVDQAGTTMTEVVNSIRRVTDIMGEISAASAQQSAGVAQIGEAVAQMDQATQQNAALVEESAAAAESLKTQAEQLVQAVAVFTLDDSSSGPAAQPQQVERRGAARAKNVTRPQFGAKKAAVPAATPEALPTAKTGTDDTWTSF